MNKRQLLEIDLNKKLNPKTHKDLVKIRKIAFKKSALVIAGLLAGLVIGVSVGAKAVTNDGDLLAQIKTAFTNAGWTPPGVVTPPTNVTKPSDVVGKLFTVMFPFSKAGSTTSPENLYITKAETDPRTPSYLYMKNGGVAFWTNAGGVHSPNSKFPRTELRQMNDENWTEAKWSNKSGTHTLEGTYSVTSSLVKRNQVVFAQAHDSSDDIFEAALNDNQLVVYYNDKSSSFVLEPNYVQGTQFSIKLVAQNSKFDVYYNGALKGSVPKGTSSGYWKTGSYIQSNVADYGEDANAGAEVVIYSLKVN